MRDEFDAFASHVDQRFNVISDVLNRLESKIDSHNQPNSSLWLGIGSLLISVVGGAGILIYTMLQAQEKATAAAILSTNRSAAAEFLSMNSRFNALENSSNLYGRQDANQDFLLVRQRQLLLEDRERENYAQTKVLEYAVKEKTTQ